MRLEDGTLLFRTQFGSHVYGTDLPTSDLDFKGIFVPSAKDILLQRAGATSLQRNTNPTSQKNAPGDVDFEAFTLQGFLRLCAEGQTVAVDMLFTPPKWWTVTTDAWHEIQINRHRLVHRGASAFVGYCQQQAAKYGIKGSRIAAVRASLEFLHTLPSHEKLLAHWDKVTAFVASQKPGERKNGSDAEFIKITPCRGPNGELVDHFEVNGRKLACHVHTTYAAQVLQKILDEYGARARLAETNEGIDWKALMHAVRVCHEAEELLTTGEVTFPRPEREMLLKVRKGEIPYKQVAEIIEAGLLRVREAQTRSALPDSIDRAFAEDLILSSYARQVRA